MRIKRVTAREKLALSVVLLSVLLIIWFDYEYPLAIVEQYKVSYKDPYVLLWGKWRFFSIISNLCLRSYSNSPLYHLGDEKAEVAMNKTH